MVLRGSAAGQAARPQLKFPNIGVLSMELSQYFENINGIGVLATADGNGHVNSAIYAKPHFMEDGTLAFIMRDRLSHANLQSNPFASYLFVEHRRGYNGKRIYLKKLREEKETERLYELRRRRFSPDSDPEKDPKFLVFFELVRVRPLLGDDKDA
jgi:hypothetical protein